MIEDDARLDHGVGALDPLPGGLAGDERLDRALDDLGELIVRHRRRAPRRRWRMSLAPRGLAAAAVAVLACGGAAYAGVRVFVNADTGHYNRGWEAKAGGPGELLNPRGTNFDQVALRASHGIPFPPGYASWRTRTITGSEQCAPGPGGCKVQVSTGELRGWLAGSAYCAWLYYWRNAKTQDASGEATLAARVITTAPSWNAVRAEDPHPTFLPRSKRTLFGWMLPFRTLVLRGDVAAVGHRLITSDRGEGRCGRLAQSAGTNTRTASGSGGMSR